MKTYKLRKNDEEWVSVDVYGSHDIENIVEELGIEEGEVVEVYKHGKYVIQTQLEYFARKLLK